MTRLLFALLLLASLAPHPAAADLGARVQNGIGAAVTEDLTDAARPGAGFEAPTTRDGSAPGERPGTQRGSHSAPSSPFDLPHTLRLVHAEALSWRAVVPLRLEHPPYYATAPPATR